MVCGSGKQVYGILVVSIGQEESIKENFKLYFKIFNWTDAFKMVLLDIVDMWFGAKLNEDDLYLATVAVEYKCRGKGVIKFILKKSMELAHKKGCKRVFLDVDRDNIPAFNLYKQFGFKIFSKKIIPWFGGIKGIYNMEYKLNRGDKG